MDIHKAKYDTIIEQLITKEVTINEIIGYLHKNRLQFNENNKDAELNIDTKVCLFFF